MRFRISHLLAITSIVAVLPASILNVENLWARCALLVLPAIVGGFLGDAAPHHDGSRRPQLRVYRCPG